MESIWKFPIVVTDDQEVEMPEGARIVTVQVQKGTLNLWAIVDPSAPLKKRHIKVVGTGHSQSSLSSLSYIGTAQMMEGTLIWHVFEEA